MRENWDPSAPAWWTGRLCYQRPRSLWCDVTSRLAVAVRRASSRGSKVENTFHSLFITLVLHGSPEMMLRPEKATEFRREQPSDFKIVRLPLVTYLLVALEQ
jgi:hypothetical protein